VSLKCLFLLAIFAFLDNFLEFALTANKAVRSAPEALHEVNIRIQSDPHKMAVPNSRPKLLTP
jgi:hypothetical protein